MEAVYAVLRICSLIVSSNLDYRYMETAPIRFVEAPGQQHHDLSPYAITRSHEHIAKATSRTAASGRAEIALRSYGRSDCSLTQDHAFLHRVHLQIHLFRLG